jgi:hypothetical protein
MVATYADMIRVATADNTEASREVLIERRL